MLRTCMRGRLGRHDTARDVVFHAIRDTDLLMVHLSDSRALARPLRNTHDDIRSRSFPPLRDHRHPRRRALAHRADDAGQLTLLRLLVDELRALGIATRRWTRTATSWPPCRHDRRQTPVIGFLAHVDTSPEMPGRDVVPIVHRHYDGGDIVLPDDPTAVLRAADDPALAARIGDDIVTASGLTLLGADDKAGVAAIMAAVEHLVRLPRSRMGRFASFSAG